MEKRKECWLQLANNLGSHIHKGSRAIIAQSFHILPYHLRSCFLYFGALLEDSVIDVSKLTRLWISEGFVKSCENQNLEDIAEGYLENLIGRNLVMGTKKSSRGKIKACHIHDLLHDFCKQRAKEENFLLWIKRDQNANNNSSRIDCHGQLAHRIAIYDEGYHIGEWSSCLSHIGTIIWHDRLKLSYDSMSNISHSFKFLKVLDLEFTRIDFFPTDLVYLRYFAARTQVLSISPFIANRWNIETLILHIYHYAPMPLPITLLEMVKLRNLHITSCSFTTENSEELHENPKKLYDLKTLSIPYFSCVEDVELILRKTPNLRELRCEINGVDNFQYYILNFPTGVETLKFYRKLFTFSGSTLPFCIFAPNLRYLTIHGFYLHSQHLSGFASLHNLQLLKLHRINFRYGEWKVSNGDFPQLKVLKLQQIDHFREWTVADDAFPNLERLVLDHCIYLKEIPSCFRDFCSLKSIEVTDCEESVEKSARDIWRTQVDDYQNYDFQVFIDERSNYHPYSDDDSAGDDDDGDSGVGVNDDDE